MPIHTSQLIVAESMTKSPKSRSQESVKARGCDSGRKSWLLVDLR